MGLTLSGDVFSVNPNDLSDNLILLSGNQNISGIKTFSQNIIGNISGNVTSVTGGLTTSSEVTDLSGITNMGSGKIITDIERTDLSNIHISPYITTTSSGDTLGQLKIGNNLVVDASGIITPDVRASNQRLGLVKIDNSSNIVINNDFITTKLPIISNYLYVVSGVDIDINSATHTQAGDTGSFNKVYSHTKLFITTFINSIFFVSGSTNCSVYFKIEIDNGGGTTWSTPDISRQYYNLAGPWGGGCRSNTLNNLSYIIDNVNVTGSLNIKLLVKTERARFFFNYPDNNTQFVINGHGFFNIEIIEYD